MKHVLKQMQYRFAKYMKQSVPRDGTPQNGTWHSPALDTCAIKTNFTFYT